MEDKYVIKYYYNNKFIGYFNSFGEGRGFTWTRLYADKNKDYIRKYKSETGAKIASNSTYFENSNWLIINSDNKKVLELSFEDSFIDEIKDQGFGIYKDKITKEICKLSEIGKEKVDLSELKEIETKYAKHIQSKVKTEGRNKLMKKDLKKQWEDIMELLNVSEEDISGGIVYLDKITLDQVNKIKEIAKDFYNDDDRQNNSPSCKELIDFVEENPQFIFEGYIVTPEREDYRFTITAIKAPNNKLNIEIMNNYINSLDEDSFPDEFDTYDGYIRAWWD